MFKFLVLPKSTALNNKKSIFTKGEKDWGEKKLQQILTAFSQCQISDSFTGKQIELHVIAMGDAQEHVIQNVIPVCENFGKHSPLYILTVQCKQRNKKQNKIILSSGISYRNILALFSALAFVMSIRPEQLTTKYSSKHSIPLHIFKTRKSCFNRACSKSWTSIKMGYFDIVQHFVLNSKRRNNPYMSS